MDWTVKQILNILDKCCDAFTFPMLDNGYVYLAATRLSLYRSKIDWGLVIEVFGFAPRSGLPDTHIYSFASRLYARDTPTQYVNPEAYKHYLANNPHNESRFIYPIEEGDWQNAENLELVAKGARMVRVRGQDVQLPASGAWVERGLVLEDDATFHVFELCRWLASLDRDAVLATDTERCVSIRPEMRQVLQLEEWHHPDVADDQHRPSNSETFQQLAEVLVTGETGRYRPTLPSNTDWQYWPGGGAL